MKYLVTQMVARIIAQRPWSRRTGLPRLPRFLTVLAALILVLAACNDALDPLESTTPKIYRLTLIDANSDEVIGVLEDGDTLDLAALGTTHLSIRAETPAARVGSVVFTLDGNRPITANNAPYVLFGNGDAYRLWSPEPGDYRLEVTPYSAAWGRGEVGETLTVAFTVILGDDGGDDDDEDDEDDGGEYQANTVVSMAGEGWLINGKLTHKGSDAEGLLLNSRMVQATFDDANPDTRGYWRYPDGSPFDPDRQTDEFIAALPDYAGRGLRAVSLNFQGGGPKEDRFGATQAWDNSAFTANGRLKDAYLARMDRVIRALDDNGMVAVIGFFYFGQDQRLESEAAVINAVDNATDWLLGQGYRNVVVEVNNEADLKYHHAILKPDRVTELITRVQRRADGALLVSTSFSGGTIPPDDVLAQADYILLHGNGQSGEQIVQMVETVRGKLETDKPILFNEDSTRVANLDAAVSAGASWGYYDQGDNNYRDGFQSPPTNWAVNTAAKRAFFEQIERLTTP